MFSELQAQQHIDSLLKVYDIYDTSRTELVVKQKIIIVCKGISSGKSSPFHDLIQIFILLAVDCKNSGSSNGVIIGVVVAVVCVLVIIGVIVGVKKCRRRNQDEDLQPILKT